MDRVGDRPHDSEGQEEGDRREEQPLPARIRVYLHARGIPDPMIDTHLLGWNGRRITIPISDRDGEVAFFKLAKDPEDQSESPKMLASPGSRAELYGWEHLREQPEQLIICEGEFDRLVLEGQALPAVTSTGGAGVFRTEWAKEMAAIPAVYMCFDRDDAGRAGALRVARMIPGAKVVELPEEVGEGGDVTDFVVRLGKTREGFLALLTQAAPPPPRPEPPTPVNEPPAGSGFRHERAARVKREVPITEVVGRFVDLVPAGSGFRGRCPFHEDRVPSFVVYPATGTFHCFGCGAHGDVIDFVMRSEQRSFREALDRLDHLHHAGEADH